MLVRSRTGRPDGVTLTDDTGMSVVATVADGVEVEILAWRPRGGDTRYRVVAPSAGVEGWLGVASLQRRDPVPPPKPAPPAIRPAARPVPVTRAAAAARTTKFAKKTTR